MLDYRDARNALLIQPRKLLFSPRGDPGSLIVPELHVPYLSGYRSTVLGIGLFFDQITTGLGVDFPLDRSPFIIRDIH